MTPAQQTDGLLARTLREESGLLVARLARQFHDFDLAEEAVQTAVTEALEAWRRDGPPNNPAAWLQTAARHNALDLVRRRSRQDGPRDAARTGARAGRGDVIEGDAPDGPPTTGWRCSSRAATRRSRPRLGWR